MAMKPKNLGALNPQPKPLKPFSFGVSAKPSTSRLYQRPSTALVEKDSDDDEGQSCAQEITGFDTATGHAVILNGTEREKAPRIIEAQPNRNWREEARRKRGKTILPAGVKAARAGEKQASTAENLGAPQEYGLTFVKKVQETSFDGHVHAIAHDVAANNVVEGVAPVKTDDEKAMEALLANGKHESDMVIEIHEEKGETQNGRPSRSNAHEDDMFKDDVNSRPDPASLDEYAATPVDEFGAAMLRGMLEKQRKKGDKNLDHWENRMVDHKPLRSRPDLLGIGAKEVPAAVVDGSGGRDKTGTGKRKGDKMFVPVLLKHKQTGLMMTEEELKAKRLDLKREEEEDARQRQKRGHSKENRGRRDPRVVRDSHEHYYSRRRDSEVANGARRYQSSRHEKSRSPTRHSGRHESSRAYDGYDRREQGPHTRYRDEANGSGLGPQDRLRRQLTNDDSNDNVPSNGQRHDRHKYYRDSRRQV